MSDSDPIEPHDEHPPDTGPIPSPPTGDGTERPAAESQWQARPSGALAAPHGLGTDEPNPWQRPGTASAPDQPATDRPGWTHAWPTPSTGAAGTSSPGQPIGAPFPPPGAAPSGAWSPTGTGRWPAATGSSPTGQPGSTGWGGSAGWSPWPGGPGRWDDVTAPQARAVGPGRSPRNLRNTLIVIAVVVLVLAAGFGGGVLGSSVMSQGNGGNADNSLSQRTPGQPASDASPAPSGSVQAVAAKVLPSVVSVVALSGSGEDEGSGVILTSSGLILTNNHVIDGAQQLTVQFNDGTTGTASVVGTDPTDDLAVIKVSGVSGLSPAILGSSASLKVGQQVVAVGSPLGLSATVTTGIVSALNRPVRTSSAGDSGSTSDQDTVLNAIQTDAAINPGNSGGPLVDMNGYVIGINSAIASLSSGAGGQSGSIGVGFAIPIDQAHRIAQEIINTGKASHAVLGATVRDATNSSQGITTGALIVSVTTGGGAAKAGIKAGDVVTKIGDTPVESADALVATIRSSTPGGKIQLTYLRDGKSSTVTVTLGSSAK